MPGLTSGDTSLLPGADKLTAILPLRYVQGKSLSGLPLNCVYVGQVDLARFGSEVSGELARAPATACSLHTQRLSAPVRAANLESATAELPHCTLTGCVSGRRRIPGVHHIFCGATCNGAAQLKGHPPGPTCEVCRSARPRYAISHHFHGLASPCHTGCNY